MRLLRSIISGILFSVFIVVSVSFIISFVYEDEISEIFLEELNKRIKANVQTESVNLSLLQKFPGASVELNNFSLVDYRDNDTILNLKAKKIFFQFDIIDIFTKDLNIKRITANDGEISIKTDEPLKIRQDKSRRNKNVTLNLEKLTISNFKYSIVNENKRLFIKGNTEKTTLSGNISSNEKILDIDSKNFIEYIKINDFSYLSNKNFHVSSKIHATSEFYSFEQGLFKLEQLPFKAHGKIQRASNNINLEINGKDIKVSDLKLYIPWKFKQKLNNVIIDSGKLDLLAKINGGMQKSLPNIEIDFSLNKGKVQIENKNNLTFNDINASGYFTNGKFNDPSSSYLVFNNLNATTGKARIKSSLEIHNFLEPSLKTKGTTETNLETLVEAFNFNQIKKPKGNITANFSLNTAIDKPIEWANLMERNKLSGDITFSEATFQYNDITIEQLTGFIYLKNQDLILDNIQLNLNEVNELNYSGTIQGLTKHLVDSTNKVSLKGSLKSENLNLNSLIARTDSTVNIFKEENSIRGNLNLNIKNLIWNNFTATALQGKLKYRKNAISITDIDCKTLSGSANVNAELLKTSDDNYQVKSQSFLNKIDINQAFRVFNNFGQEYLVHNNISGKISGETIFSADLSSDLKVIKPSVHNVSDFTIHNGELYKFTPLNSLSRFVDISELQHIKFSKLKNKITIKDEVVYIPAMEINSSALDLNLEGYHHFDGEYRYRVNLLLSEILRKKANKNVTKYGKVEDDGVGKTKLFLIMENVDGESKIRYDKEGVREKIKQDIQEEKTELKQILFDEFGLFKNDTSIGNYNKKELNEFKIKWEEENIKINEEKKDTGIARPDSEFKIRWEEDSLIRKK
ncbi:MAG: AsmA-like C-terminal region-containing protein [Bacteroidales bacterium]